jgi:hypothetical protein
MTRRNAVGANDDDVIALLAAAESIAGQVSSCRHATPR